jgi:predicted metalloprotease
MRLDDLRPSDNVDDRRGQGGGGFGPRMAFGGGGLGLVAVLAISLIFGIDPRQLLEGGGPMPMQRAERDVGICADDKDCQFARQIIGSAEDIWSPLMQESGGRFVPATFTPYDQVTPTGCGTGQASAGPFYCPSDRGIYLDLTFFNELGQRFGAPGQFARAYVIAHEYGHHIQNLMGTLDQRGGRERGADSDAVRVELQADCYAGVWAYRTDKQFNMLESGDVESGMQAASAVGDDTLQKQTQGYVVPDSFTHGSSAQRIRWFRRGLNGGDVAACDTFSAASL